MPKINKNDIDVVNGHLTATSKDGLKLRIGVKALNAKTG